MVSPRGLDRLAEPDAVPALHDPGPRVPTPSRNLPPDAPGSARTWPTAPDCGTPVAPQGAQTHRRGRGRQVRQSGQRVVSWTSGVHNNRPGVAPRRRRTPRRRATAVRSAWRPSPMARHNRALPRSADHRSDPTRQCDVATAWRYVTDIITVPARCSAELQSVEWLDDADHVEVGADSRPQHQRRHRGWETTCEVVEVEIGGVGVQRPRTRGTRRQLEFRGRTGRRRRADPAVGTDGAGSFGTQYLIAAQPDKEARIVARRLSRGRQNMAANLEWIGRRPRADNEREAMVRSRHPRRVKPSSSAAECETNVTRRGYQGRDDLDPTRVSTLAAVGAPTAVAAVGGERADDRHPAPDGDRRVSQWRTGRDRAPSAV